MRSKPWGRDFGKSWWTELERLGLHDHEPRLTFKGLRTTDAALVAEGAAQRSAIAVEAYARVQAMLGHHSSSTSEHYARRAKVEVSNRRSVEMLPSFKRKND